MKVLTVDIETRPNVVHTWGLYKQDVGMPQLRIPGRVISFAAKWHGEKPVIFASEYHNGHEEMIAKAWALLDAADVVVHYNGSSFDMPWLKTEFLQAGLGMPAPWKDIDLYLVVKKNFRFPTNKLAYVTRELGLTGKLQHTGHEMWVDIMEGDPDTQRKAWNLMRRYNKRDVVITEQLLDKLRPFIKFPNPLLYDQAIDPETCQCGGTYIKRGFAYTSVSAYQRYQCNGCGAWTKSGKRLYGIDLRSAL